MNIDIPNLRYCILKFQHLSILVIQVLFTVRMARFKTKKPAKRAEAAGLDKKIDMSLGKVLCTNFYSLV